MSKDTFSVLLRKLKSPQVLFIAIFIVGSAFEFYFIKYENKLPTWLVDLLHGHRF